MVAASSSSTRTRASPCWASAAERPGSPLSLEQNQDAFALPELSSELGAAGARAWAGGARAWAGGARAWAGGARAWAGGAATWDGSVPTEPSFTPLNNARAGQQIGLFEAHTKLAPHLGDGVVVAVIDTGLDLAHPLFTDRLVPGWDFLDNDARPQDEGPGDNYGHGTAVAGVLLQVAPQAKIMPLRVLNADGQGDTDDLVLAINWAIEHGANLINLSLGATETSSAVGKVLAKAKNKGVAVIASSGNSGDRNVTFPAREAVKNGAYKDTLVSVGSVNAADEKSSFSTYQKDMVEIVAPGELIFTAYPNDRVIYWSGTSFAAPMVSGALALALGEPNLDKAPKDLPKLVVEKVMDDLYKVGTNGKLYKDGLCKGRLDLEKVLSDVLK
ncbi:hypothetical protein BH24DEI2_BH24DEI2_24950 [soil metagenome]